jgi:hypothetical protein
MRANAALRLLLVPVVYAVLLWAASLALRLLAVEGAARLGALLLFHLAFGVLGYFALPGRLALRAVLVAAAPVIYSAMAAMLSGEARNPWLQVALAIPLGVIAAVASVLTARAARILQERRS